jgi:hypothetical protein
MGIITTIAGNGVQGLSGNGGAATAASLFQPASVAEDKFGNIYIAEDSDVRKIDTNGIISRFAGGGALGFGGDGGPASAAKFNQTDRVFTDDTGNIYVSDFFNYRIRKIDTAGIVTTFAGNGVCGYSGTGGRQRRPASGIRLGWLSTGMATNISGRTVASVPRRGRIPTSGR